MNPLMDAVMRQLVPAYIDQMQAAPESRGHPTSATPDLPGAGSHQSRREYMTASTALAMADEPDDDANVVRPASWRTEKPWSGVVMVTPEIAVRWLEFNTGNRRLKPDSIAAFTRDMSAGNWKLTGEAIKFAKSGRLLDGQNRLTAIIKSNASVPMFVIRGLEDDVQRVMDTGTKRTSSDDLTMQHEKNTSLLASTIRLIVGADAVGMRYAGRYTVTNSEVADFLDSHPSIRETVDFSREVARRIDCYPSVVGYAFYYLSQIDRGDAEAFFTAASSKVGLTDGDPVIAMTNRFAEARRNREKLPHEVQLSILYRAWNARRAGKTMKFIRVKSTKGSGSDISIPEPK